MSGKEDVLNRENFIENMEKLINIISDRKQGCCFGLDGAWGSGKSFVLDKLEDRIKDIQLEEIGDSKYFVFHYDCWKYDYYEEPAIAIISAMLDATNQEMSLFNESTNSKIRLGWNTVKKTLCEVAKELCKNKIGIDLVTVAEEVLKEHDEENENSFDVLYGFKRALEETREGIRKIAENKTVIVVVDELDRCLPTYTIKILERLHHIFYDIENVIVIVSMDKMQIEHSIQQIYGDIKVDVYLRKFISFEVSLDNGLAHSFIDKYQTYTSMFDFTENEREKIEKFISDLLLGMDMRTQERIFRKAEIIHKIIKDNDIRDCSIMTFEILYITILSLMKQREINWLIENSHYVDVERKLGKDYYNMLRTHMSVAVNERQKINGMKCIHDTLMGKTFFWIASICSEHINGKCSPFYYNKSVEKELAVVNNFVKVYDIIGYD